jgi:NAD-dependent DNA ligase
MPPRWPASSAWARSRRRICVEAIEKLAAHHAGALHLRARHPQRRRGHRADLARHFGSLDALIAADARRCSRCRTSARSWPRASPPFFAEPHNREVIEQLRAAGVRGEAEGEPQGTGAPLAGKTFVLTGTLPTLSRDEAKALIEAAGGKVSRLGVEEDDYVVAGEEAGSKLDKARTLGIAVIDEDGLRSCWKRIGLMQARKLTTAAAASQHP